MKGDIQVIDLMISERAKKPIEDRKVDGLIAMLLKIAKDLQSGKAIEMDFNINIEELNHYDEISLSLKTYHLRDTSKKIEG